jgi:ParB family chromosome partitioning protein
MAQIFTEGHARAILMLEQIDQMLILRDKIVHENLSVRQAEKLAKEFSATKITKPTTNNIIREKDVEIMELENHFTELLGTKVIIHDKGNKGKIEIEYYSIDDFEKIKKLLENNRLKFF